MDWGRGTRGLAALVLVVAPLGAMPAFAGTLYRCDTADGVRRRASAAPVTDPNVDTACSACRRSRCNISRILHSTGNVNLLVLNNVDDHD